MQNRRLFGSTRCLPGFAILTGLSAVAALAQSVGAFVPTGVMKTPRLFATATLLKDGRVLIAGGLHCDVLNHCDALASAELYDPSTETFAATGNMRVAREFHSAALLSDGRVLIAGGSSTRQWRARFAARARNCMIRPLERSLRQGNTWVLRIFRPLPLLLRNGKSLDRRVSGDSYPATAEIY